MVKTVVLIGNFFGELNCLKESIGRINQEIRFLSFLDPSSALSMLENNSIPVADFILTDELVAFTTLKSHEESRAFGCPSIDFIHARFRFPVPLPRSAHLSQMPK